MMSITDRLCCHIPSLHTHLPKCVVDCLLDHLPWLCHAMMDQVETRNSGGANPKASTPIAPAEQLSLLYNVGARLEAGRPTVYAKVSQDLSLTCLHTTPKWEGNVTAHRSCRERHLMGAPDPDELITVQALPCSLPGTTPRSRLQQASR